MKPSTSARCMGGSPSLSEIRRSATGETQQSTFETGVDLHRMVDAIKQASDGSRGDVRLARFVGFFELDFPRYCEGDLKSGSSRNDPNWRTLICGNKFDDRRRLRGRTIVVGGIGATDGTQSSHEPDREDEGVKSRATIKIPVHDGLY